jgi:hypothetical protein
MSTQFYVSFVVHTWYNFNLLQELAHEIAEAEAIIAQSNSLELKFSLAPETAQAAELRTFLLKLMNSSEVDVPGGPRGAIGSRIRTMFSDAQKVNGHLFKHHFLGLPLFEGNFLNDRNN